MNRKHPKNTIFINDNTLHILQQKHVQIIVFDYILKNMSSYFMSMLQTFFLKLTKDKLQYDCLYVLLT